MKLPRLPAAIAGLAALLAWPAIAQSPDSLQVRSWAAACANCHGTSGHALPGLASLAGMAQADIVRKMQDFKNGRAPATVMHQLARGYGDDEIAAIAGYFAAQKNGAR